MAAIVPYIPAILGALGSIGGGLLGSREPEQPRESPIQKQQKMVIDQLLSSLGGQGPYSDLFNMDEAAFQKSYVDPAKSMFQNQIAPQIQQESIFGGQQRGTGMEDTLARAGVDLDQMLNQQYGQMQQQAQQNQMGAIGKILGAAPGVAEPRPEPSFGQRFGEATAGYLGGSSFPKSLEQIFDKRPNNLPKGYVG